MPLEARTKKEMLVEVLDQAKARQYPWLEQNRARLEAEEMEQYERQYTIMTEAFKEHWANMMRKEREANNQDAE